MPSGPLSGVRVIDRRHVIKGEQHAGDKLDQQQHGDDAARCL